MKLTDEIIEWLSEQISDHKPQPKGGRPPVSKGRALSGIFWILDNGARWKDFSLKRNDVALVPYEQNSAHGAHDFFDDSDLELYFSAFPAIFKRLQLDEIC